MAGAVRYPPHFKLVERNKMKNSRKRNFISVAILSVMLGGLVAFPLLSRARSTTSVNIVNNRNRSVLHVYISHVNADDWSSDLLSGQTISSGQSTSVSNLSCDQQQVKVIAEDQDGCFLTTVVSCGTTATWTITNDSVADCGSN